MRKATFFLRFCFIATFSFSQAKVEKYCQLTMTLKGDLSGVRSVHVSLGNSLGLFNLKDSNEIKQLQMAETLTTQTDVLNYISQLGWHSAGIYYYGGAWVVMYFKKEFDKTELINP